MAIIQGSNWFQQNFSNSYASLTRTDNNQSLIFPINYLSGLNNDFSWVGNVELLNEDSYHLLLRLYEDTNTKYQLYIQSGQIYHDFNNNITAIYAIPLTRINKTYNIGYSYEYTTGDVNLYLNGKNVYYDTSVYQNFPMPNHEMMTQYVAGQSSGLKNNFSNIGIFNRVLTADEFNYIAKNNIFPSSTHENVKHQYPLSSVINKSTHIGCYAGTSGTFDSGASNAITIDASVEGYIEFVFTPLSQNGYQDFGFVNASDNTITNRTDVLVGIETGPSRFQYISNGSLSTTLTTPDVGDTIRITRLSNANVVVRNMTQGVDLTTDVATLPGGAIKAGYVSYSYGIIADVNQDGSTIVWENKVNVSNIDIIDVVKQYDYAIDQGTILTSTRASGAFFYTNDLSTNTFTEGDRLTYASGSVNTIVSTNGTIGVGEYFIYDITIFNWEGIPRISIPYFGIGNTAKTIYFRNGPGRYKGAVKNEGTTSRSGPTAIWDIDEGAGWDIIINTWREGTTGNIENTPSNGIHINYSDLELGLGDNISERTAFKDFYSKDTAIPACQSDNENAGPIMQILDPSSNGSYYNGATEPLTAFFDYHFYSNTRNQLLEAPTRWYINSGYRIYFQHPIDSYKLVLDLTNYGFGLGKLYNKRWHVWLSADPVSGNLSASVIDPKGGTFYYADASSSSFDIGENLKIGYQSGGWGPRALKIRSALLREKLTKAQIQELYSNNELDFNFTGYETMAKWILSASDNIYDLTGNGNNLNNIGGTEVQAFLEPYSLMQPRKKALNFDGVNDYLRVVGLNATRENGYTFICGFKLDGTIKNTGIYGYRGQAGGQASRGYWMYLQSGTGFLDNYGIITLNVAGANLNNKMYTDFIMHTHKARYSQANGRFYTAQGINNVSFYRSSKVLSNDTPLGFDGYTRDFLIGQIDTTGSGPTAGWYMKGHMFYFAIFAGDIPTLEAIDIHNNMFAKNPNLDIQKKYSLELFIDFNNPFDDAGTLKFPDLSPNNLDVIAEGYTDLATLESNLVDIDTLR